MNECIKRESHALEKMNEALELTEETEKAKDNAVKEYQEIKVEFDKLVGILGDVMRDAGQRVQTEMRKMRVRYKERISKLESVIEKYKTELNSERECRKQMIERTRELDKKLKESIFHTEAMDGDLQKASQDIVRKTIPTSTSTPLKK